MNPIIPISILTICGFVEDEGDTLDNGCAYRCWTYEKNNFIITLTYTFDKEEKLIHCMVELNGETLEGRSIKACDILNLMEII